MLPKFLVLIFYFFVYIVSIYNITNVFRTPLRPYPKVLYAKSKNYKYGIMYSKERETYNEKETKDIMNILWVFQAQYWKLD